MTKPTSSLQAYLEATERERQEFQKRQAQEESLEYWLAKDLSEGFAELFAGVAHWTRNIFGRRSGR